MNNTTKSKCCKEGYPKCPYTHVELAFDNCCIGCDKPGIGAADHNPADNRNSDCTLCCCPCALILDIVLSVPMFFGCYIVEPP